jgi:hypothetical protein
MADPSLVPFGSIPSCAAQNCAKNNSVPLACSTITTACRLLSAPTAKPRAEPPTSSGSLAEDRCITFSRSCYCNLASPLQCAWEPCKANSTDWADWLKVEDWFNIVCPTASPVPFKDRNDKPLLPDCASRCLIDNTFNYGCITGQRNCFCSQRTVFQCAAECNAKDNATVVAWYASVCAVSPEAATSALGAPKVGDPVIPLVAPWTGFEWYEYLVLAVLGLVVSTGILYLVFRERLRRHHLRQVMHKKQN